MHPFVCLGAALALALGQAESADPPPAAESGPAREEAPPAPTDPGAVASPPRAPPRASVGGERPSSPARPAEPERAQVARAALAFLDALVAGDPVALTAASTERFSFDGDVRSGKDEVRRAWRSLLAGRDASTPASLLDLELLTASEAVARLGPAPPRLAALAGARGCWIAVANVSGRPVVLFLARDGNRWAVTGIH